MQNDYSYYTNSKKTNVISVCVCVCVCVCGIVWFGRRELNKPAASRLAAAIRHKPIHVFYFWSVVNVAVHIMGDLALAWDWSLL